jgi:putative spermidine/putrescine transport system permease protein
MMISENLSLKNNSMKKTTRLIPAALFAVLVVLPFSAGLVYDLLYSFGITGVLTNGFTFLYWNAVLTSAAVLRSFLFTIAIAIASILIASSLAMLFVITGTKKQSGGSSYFLYLPLTIPPLAAAFFTFQFLSGSGILSRILNALHFTNGIDGFPNLINDALGLGIVFTHVMLAFPFFTILFQNYYHSEKLHSLKELAFTLGATNLQFNRTILVPVLLKKSAAPLLLYFLFVLGSFEIPLILGRQDPQMISVLINRKLSLFNLDDIPQGYIIAILYTLLVSLLVMMVMKIKKKKHA